MIKKTENCLYCGAKMESITAKKRFCSNLHRVYWNREQKAKKEFEITTYQADPGAEKITTDHLGGNTIEEIFSYDRMKERMEPKEGDKSISKEPYNIVPPMPKKEDFKHSIDFAAAKSEWKLKYGQ